MKGCAARQQRGGKQLSSGQPLILVAGHELFVATLKHSRLLIKDRAFIRWDP